MGGIQDGISNQCISVYLVIFFTDKEIVASKVANLHVSSISGADPEKTKGGVVVVRAQSAWENFAN